MHLYELLAHARAAEVELDLPTRAHRMAFAKSRKREATETSNHRRPGFWATVSTAVLATVRR